jgi:hypothetical protein
MSHVSSFPKHDTSGLQCFNFGIIYIQSLNFYKYILASKQLPIKGITPFFRVSHIFFIRIYIWSVFSIAYLFFFFFFGYGKPSTYWCLLSGAWRTNKRCLTTCSDCHLLGTVKSLKRIWKKKKSPCKGTLNSKCIFFIYLFNHKVIKVLKE